MSIAEISRFVLRHKFLVVLAWVVITVAGMASTGPASDALSERFDLPGRESTEVNTAIIQQYGNGGFAAPYVAVVELPEGTTVDSPGVADELGTVFAGIADAAPQIRIVSYASTGDRAFVSEDGQTTFGLIYPRYAGQSTSPDEAIVEEALADASVAGAEVHLTGLAEVEASEEGGGTGVLIETLVGAGGALIVLLWVFGSALAILPIVIAGIAILTSFLLVWALTGITDVSFIVQFLIALIGLGVAIDYSLLVVTRWREERERGLDNVAAVQCAMETAGHAVIFSGTTVAVGLLALVVLPVPFMRSIGLGGMVIPLVSIAVTITLLPVILATIGPRLEWPHLRRRQASGVRRQENDDAPVAYHPSRITHGGFWERWAKAVVRRRGIAVVVGVALLAALLVPALSMELASPASPSFAEDDAASDALDRAKIPVGARAPFEVLVAGADPTEIAANLATVEGVAGAIAPKGAAWRGAESSVVLVMPEAEGDSDDGRATLDRVRDVAHALPGEVRVGGVSAGDADFIDAIYGSFPLMLALIVVATFILLVRAFRSILLPLKAVILNCVSVAATYGILVLVWQDGYGSDLIWGIEATGAIPNWLPLMIFAFLFGLSMDYEVFILARMREEYDLTGSTSAAVVRGMSHTARLVTTAALILFLAFVSMAAIPEVDVKIMATGLAAGILLDATVVRALLVPATVALMGKWNWWLPGWLERFVPETAHGTAARGSD